MTNTLIILAGGASSRMKSSTSDHLSEEAIIQANTRSKALIMIKDRPMLDYLLYHAKQAGITNVIIVIHPEGTLFTTYYGSKPSGNLFHGIYISYAIQHIPESRIKPLGTADAVLQALQQYPQVQQDSFIVCNCDNLYSIEAIHALRFNKNPNAFINYNRAAIDYPMKRIARFALTKTDEQHYLQDIIEKPSSSEIENYRGNDGAFRVSMNIFKFYGPQVYQFLVSCEIHPDRQEKELPSAIRAMITDNAKAMQAIPFAEHVPDLTGKDDIIKMNDYLSAHTPDLDWTKEPTHL